MQLQFPETILIRDRDRDRDRHLIRAMFSVVSFVGSMRTCICGRGDVEEWWLEIKVEMMSNRVEIQVVGWQGEEILSSFRSTITQILGHCLRESRLLPNRSITVCLAWSRAIGTQTALLRSRRDNVTLMYNEIIIKIIEANKQWRWMQLFSINQIGEKSPKQNQR